MKLGAVDYGVAAFLTMPTFWRRILRTFVDGVTSYFTDITPGFARVADIFTVARSITQLTHYFLWFVNSLCQLVSQQSPPNDRWYLFNSLFADSWFVSLQWVDMWGQFLKVVDLCCPCDQEVL